MKNEKCKITIFHRFWSLKTASNQKVKEQIGIQKNIALFFNLLITKTIRLFIYRGKVDAVEISVQRNNLPRKVVSFRFHTHHIILP